MTPLGGDFSLDASALGAPEAPPSIPSTGRAALFHLCRLASSTAPVEEVWLPAYLCETMISAVERAGLRPRFYPLTPDLRVARERFAPKAKALVVLVSYFGLREVEEDVRWLRGAHPDVRIIRDDVHRPLEPLEKGSADYAFTSLRKGMGVPDGAPTDPPVELARSARPSAFALARLAAGLLKAQGERHEPAWVELFREGERLAGAQDAWTERMGWFSVQLHAATAREQARRRRRENFATLQGLLSPLGLAPLLPLGDAQAPLFLPVCVERRDEVRAALARERIFCPVHWPRPSAAGEAIDSAEALYRTELSLLVDQRLGPAELGRMVAALVRAGAQPSMSSSAR